MDLSADRSLKLKASGLDDFAPRCSLFNEVFGKLARRSTDCRKSKRCKSLGDLRQGNHAPNFLAEP